MVAETENVVVSVDTGHARLNELGYKQELKRDLSVISNFAFSFSIISVLTGVTTLYNNGLQFGGPTVIYMVGLLLGFLQCLLVYQWLRFVHLIQLLVDFIIGVLNLLVLLGLPLPRGSLDVGCHY